MEPVSCWLTSLSTGPAMEGGWWTSNAPLEKTDLPSSTRYPL